MAKEKKVAVEIKAVTTAEAAKMYLGVTELQLSRMCLKGERLKRLYGSDIPMDQLATAIMARKSGKYWFIPLDELNRVFAVQ